MYWIESDVYAIVVHGVKINKSATQGALHVASRKKEVISLAESDVNGTFGQWNVFFFSSRQNFLFTVGPIVRMRKEDISLVEIDVDVNFNQCKYLLFLFPRYSPPTSFPAVAKD